MGLLTTPFDYKLSIHSVQCRGHHIEVREAGFHSTHLLRPLHGWQGQLQDNVPLLLRLDVSQLNFTTTCMRLCVQNILIDSY